jgi:glycosyltransferase involved in cell wall biosynthesis
MTNSINPDNWAIYYHNDGFNIKGDRIMGRQAAGWSFLKGVVNSNPSNLGLYIQNEDQKISASNDIKAILRKDQKIEIDWIPFSQPNLSSKYGGIFFPGPDLNEYSFHRSFHGHDAYSLVGITHTTASHGVMSSLRQIEASSLMPWDAIICTSKSVLDTVHKVVESNRENLNAKNITTSNILPKFPIIPLGIDNDEFNFSENEKIQARKKLKISKDDIVLIFVGRLSFHAKAHHLPMYLALEQASKKLKNGAKLHLIQTGWFPNDYIKETFENEAKQICPSIQMHFLDGKDQENKRLTFLSGDIFISLSDNIQETFGLTPLEGMASGLPVIVSDWNGYRDTVKDKENGFRVRTISLSEGNGEDLAYSHMMGVLNYDHYIGYSSQRIAIDVKDCINKIILLIENKDLRKKLGINAKARAKNIFDWSIILNEYNSLRDELNLIREKESKNYPEMCNKKLPSDRLDPFFLFSSYPSAILNKDTNLNITKDIILLDLDELYKLKSIEFANPAIPSIEKIKEVYDIVNERKSTNIGIVSSITKINIKEIYRIIIWLIKFGYVSLIEE